MEPIQQRRHKASKFAREDVISNMPDNVVTNILNRLPLQYAVRTGILSRDWRFKWTMLSELVFDEEFYDCLIKRACYGKSRRIINRLLSHFQCAITKIVIHVRFDSYEIEQWILFLTKKRVEDLTIRNRTCLTLKLPSHFFSLLELKHLNLNHCYFNPPTSFHGFPNLLSLELCQVKFESGKFCEFFTQCPVPEILNMGYTEHAQVKLVEIAKLTNLKILTLFMCNIDYTMITSSSVIFELLGLLPKLQELELDFTHCETFTEDGAIKRCPSTFHCLKTLKLSEIELGNGMMSSFAFEMIRRSPNLQTLEITASYWDFDLPHAVLSPLCSPEDKDGPRKWSSTTFPCLKTLKLIYINLCSGNMLSFSFEIIRSSPNLQTLEITAEESDVELSPAILSPESFTEDGANTFSFLKTLNLFNIHSSSGIMLSFTSIIIRSSSILQTLEMTAGDWSFTEDGAATFPCLKTLKLSDMNLGSDIMLSSAFEMIRSSPSLHTLEITSADCLLNENSEKKRLPATFPCLETLKLSNIDLGSDIMLSFAFDIIRSSPNLQTLEITAGKWDVKSPSTIVSSEVDYNAIGMLHLRSVVFRDLKHSEDEVCLIKYLLACSPFLEKICIHLEPHLSSDEKLMFAKKLLKLHRASGVVDINLY